MPIALGVLAMGEEALRHDRVQIVLRARHRDIEQPPLLLDFRRRAGAEIGGDAAVDGIEHEDRLPFLALGGMDRREDQIILVEQRHAGLIAGGVRRIERQFGQEPLARRIARRDLLELQQVGLPQSWRLRECVRDAARTSAARSSISAGQPARPSRRCLERIATKPVQSSPERGGAGISESAAIGSELSAIRSSTRCADVGPTPGRSCIRRKPADPVARVLGEAQQRQHVLDVRAVEEFEAAELDERNVAAGELDFERAAVMRRAEQHGLLLQARAGFAVLQHALDDVARLVGLVAHADELRAAPPTSRSVQRFLVKRSRARSITPLAAARIGCVER